MARHPRTRVRSYLDANRPGSLSPPSPRLLSCFPRPWTHGAGQRSARQTSSRIRSMHRRTRAVLLRTMLLALIGAPSGTSRPIAHEATRCQAGHAAVQSPALGRGGGRRQGTPALRRNPERLFIPASNTKLVVTVVASALLRPDWTVRTSVYAGGPVVNGVVQGDLILYGRGDPTMGHRCYATDSTAAGVCDTDSFARLRQLADTLRARGIREIQGDLVGTGVTSSR